MLYCANNPISFAFGCKGYICPMWKNNNGLFDESGFEIDQILKVTHGNIDNLQLLCPCCYSVKTNKNNWIYTFMDTGIIIKKTDFMDWE